MESAVEFQFAIHSIPKINKIIVKTIKMKQNIKVWTMILI